MHYFFCFAACLYKYLFLLLISSVMSDSLLPHGLQHTRPPVLHCLLELAQTHVHWVGDAFQQSHPLSSPSSTSVFPRNRVFSNDLALRIRGPNYWSFSCSISPSNEYSGLISFRMDWLDLLAVQGTLKSLLQQHSSKASVFLWSNSHIYMTTRKTIALTTQTFVGKVMILLFNTRFVIEKLGLS